MPITKITRVYENVVEAFQGAKHINEEHPNFHIHIIEKERSGETIVEAFMV